jgi:hypothetical protein
MAMKSPYKILVLSLVVAAMGCAKPLDGNKSPATNLNPTRNPNYVKPLPTDDDPLHTKFEQTPTTDGNNSNPQVSTVSQENPNTTPPVISASTDGYDYETRLGAFPDTKEFKTLKLQEKFITKLKDGKFLISTAQIDNIFKSVIMSKSDLDEWSSKYISTKDVAGVVRTTNKRFFTAAEKLYNNNVSDMNSFGIALTIYVNSKNPTDYNKAMYNYFFEIYASRCQVWSGDKDQERCPSLADAREKLRASFDEKYDKLLASCREDLSKLEPVILAEVKK